MKVFTIVGYYDDTQQKYCGAVEAEDCNSALSLLRRTEPSATLCICAVFEGLHRPVDDGELVFYLSDGPAVEDE